MPADWSYVKARELFKQPLVTAGADVSIKFGNVDQEGLTDFLVNKKGFNPERVAGYIDKLIKAKEKCSQKRMDAFFTVKKGLKRDANSSGESKGTSKKQKK